MAGLVVVEAIVDVAVVEVGAVSSGPPHAAAISAMAPSTATNRRGRIVRCYWRAMATAAVSPESRENGVAHLRRAEALATRCDVGGPVTGGEYGCHRRFDRRGILLETERVP